MQRTIQSKSFSIIAIILTFIIFFTLSAGQTYATAKDNSDSKGRMNFVSYIDANLYTERLVYEVFESLGYDVSVTLQKNESCVEVANFGVYDGIAVFPDIDSSKYPSSDYNQLVKIPVETATERYYSIVNGGDRNIYSSWDDLKGKTVGVLGGNQNIKDNLPGDIKKCVEKPSYTLLYEALTKGKCDLIVIADTSGKAPQDMLLPTDKRISGSLGSEPCYIYLNKKYASLVDDAVKKINEMKQDGSFEKMKAMKPTQNREEQTVFYLSSYSSEMRWEQSVLTGVSNVLNKYGDIIYHNIALNSFRNTNISAAEDQMLSIISSDFIHSPPDAVIVSDNEAMQFLMNNYNSLLPNDIPVAFCGMNNGSLVTPSFIKKYENIGGVIEDISASDTVEEALKLFPKTERIFVINDYTLTGRRWHSDIEAQLKKYSDKVEIVYNDNISYDELMEQVSDLKEGSVILSGSYFLDSGDHYYPQVKLQRELKKASSVPIFGLLDTTQGMGALGGKYANAVSQGETAADLIVEVLTGNGEDRIDMVEIKGENHWAFDINIMKEYGISKDDLPAGTTILNSKPPLYQSNPVLFYSILAGAFVLFVIIALLSAFAFILRRRNKKLVEAEGMIKTSRDEIIRVKNRLQTIIDTAPIAYSLLVDDIVIECNRYYREHIGPLNGQKNGPRYKGQNYTRYLDLMDQCREEGVVENIAWQLEKDNETGEAHKRYIYNIASTEYKDQDAIVMWGVDVEQLESQKDALSRAHHDLQQVIESTPMPIVLVYPKEKDFIYANPSWYELMEIPDSLHISNFKMGRFSAQNIDDLIKQAFDEDKIISAELKFDTYEGNRFEAMTYFKKVMYGGKECLVITHKDLSEEKAREKMLLNAAEKEKEANRLKGHFLMNIGHEIRTPMNSIIGMTQIVSPSDDKEKLFSSITQIGRSATVLLDLVNSVLDMSMIEEGKMVLDPKPSSLFEIITGVCMVIDIEADKKRLGRVLNIDGIEHDHVIVDTSRLEQVLVALFSNAVKFTGDEGMMSLTVEETDQKDGVATYLFKIEDNGIGIEANKMDRLFKYFEQGDDSITREYSGMGLGLSISRKIVELMDGEIWVESEVGKGSIFSFTIKVPYLTDDASDNSGDDNDTEQVDTSTAEYSDMNILIVDDVDINRLILEELLTDIGVTTDTACNGQQALNKIALSEPGFYDLVLMDIQMPVMDGMAAAKAIRALDRPDTDALPIIAVTANALPGDIEVIKDSGMDAYISKPVFKEQLLVIMRKYIKGKDA